MNLRLTVHKPGSLLGKLLNATITEQQYRDIEALLRHPNDYHVVRRHPTIGFRNPEGGASARS